MPDAEQSLEYQQYKAELKKTTVDTIAANLKRMLDDEMIHLDGFPNMREFLDMMGE